MIKVLLNKFKKNAILPKRMSNQAAGYDLYSANEKTLKLEKNSLIAVPTGLTIALPTGYEAQIRPRSGLSYRHMIGVLNSPGTIDSDYRGEIKVLLYNFGEKDFLIEPCMRIAQMVITSYETAEFVQKSQLPNSKRGKNGLGSTNY